MKIPEWQWRLAYIVNNLALRIVLFISPKVKNTKVYKDYFEKDGITFETSKKFYTERCLAKDKSSVFMVIYLPLIMLALILNIIILLSIRLYVI